MADERLGSRRRYSPQMKALVLEQCATPGASVAKVAMSHGVNANVVHRWRQLAREGQVKGAAATPVSMREFVPVSLAAPSQVSGTDIRIDLRRGATTMMIAWPITAAVECAAWMRELLR